MHLIEPLIYGLGLAAMTLIGAFGLFIKFIIELIF